MSSLGDKDIDSKEYSKRGKGWFSVDAADYLSRGEGHLGLEGKLHAYLRSQGLNPEEYPYAYLVTAPRFLGYSFNPVSFWFLYSEIKELKAMILEVNNTFDERRVYFLQESRLGEDADGPEHNTSNDSNPNAHRDEAVRQPHFSTITTRPGRFCRSWAKDFHVSPFNSRKGSYSLAAYDPLHPSMSGKGPIDNTITLDSTKAHAKLIARIFSTGPALDPAQLDARSTIRFIQSWWWVGFMTFPRILKEAGKLFLRKKLHIWYRPEVSKDSIPRHETELERTLEQYFRMFLEDLVRQSEHDVVVKYVAAGSHCRQEKIFYSAKSASNGTSNHVDTLIELRVLTPAFYSSFIKHACVAEAFDAEMLCAIEEKRTLWASKPELLPLIFPDYIGRNPGTAKSLEVQCLDRLDRWRWSALRMLRSTPKRRSPNRIRSSICDNLMTTKAVDIITCPLSPMDTFILRCCTTQNIRKYRRAVTKSLISRRLAFGTTGLLELYDIILRLFLAWVAAQILQAALPPASMAKSPSPQYSSYLLLNTNYSLTATICNSMHIWAYLKSMF
ncbi:MAG: hypothetical protein M1830_000056 [Pleopsidium flavum]|nr:MAG: hypothetical protein M1830_000056 [Pleopsidium flavum]